MFLELDILSYLGNVAEYLGWTVKDMESIVTDTLRVYGVTDEADATDTNKLYLIAKVEAWRKACYNLAVNFNFSADGASFTRRQVYDAAYEQFKLAYYEAQQYYSSFCVIETGNVDNAKQDPYGYYPDYLRTK